MIDDKVRSRTTPTMPKFGLGRAYIRLTGTNPTISWGKLRKAVFARDNGKCQVCYREVTWGGNYECGHIVDRVAGGKDEMENLVAMCYSCNRLKPVHDTREEYDAWKNAGGVAGAIVEFTKERYPEVLEYFAKQIEQEAAANRSQMEKENSK